MDTRVQRTRGGCRDRSEDGRIVGQAEGPHVGVGGRSEAPWCEDDQLGERDERTIEVIGRCDGGERAGITEPGGDGGADERAATPIEVIVAIEDVGEPAREAIGDALAEGERDRGRCMAGCGGELRERRRVVRRRGGLGARCGEPVRVVGVDADGIGDAVVVAEQGGLQERVQDRGIIETGGAEGGAVGARDRPRSLGDGDREGDECACRGIAMAREGVGIHDHDPREGVISESGTQKLCVSDQSIEALVEARRERGDELAL